MTKEQKRLWTRNKWCYSIGGLRDVIYTFVTMFIMVYIQYTVPLTNAQFAAVGIIMTLSKVWDAVNDPMMAAIVENCRFKSGKFRPWILWGAVTSAVITALIFLVRIDSGWGYVAFIGVMFLLWDLAFTMNDVGFWSMLPTLGSTPDDRNRVTTLMQIFGALASFAVSAVVPMVTGVDKVSRYGICAVVVVSIFFLSQLLTYFGVKEPPRDPSESGEKITFKRMFAIIRGNDQLLWVALVLCCYYLGSGLLLQFGMNFCYFEFGYANGGSVYMTFAIVFLVATLLSQLMFPPLASRLPRKRVLSLGVYLALAGYAILMLLRYVLPTGMLFICLSAALIFGGQNLISLTLLVQMTNTIEYNELISGQRNESVVFSMRSFLAKLTSAAQALIVSAVLLISGIKSATDNIAVLEESLSYGEVTAEFVTAEAEKVIAATPGSATLVLRLGMVVIPVVLLLVSLAVDKSKYNISEERYDEIVRELDERHEKARAAQSL